MKKEKNLLIIMADQLNSKMLGCYDNPYAITPNIDKLALRGTTFTSAYCNNPICVPSRASMITGDYASKLEYWDNAHPYSGQHRGWSHELTDQGYDVTAIGKLHFKDNECDVGIPDQRISMSAYKGTGDIAGCIRNEQVRRSVRIKTITTAGVGETDYQKFDIKVANESANFLNEAKTKESDKPFVLFVGFIAPHHPYKAPQEYFDLFKDKKLPFPINYKLSERPMHPVVEYNRRSNCLDTQFSDSVVENLVKSYYACTSFVDTQVGVVLDALKESGLEDDTRVIFVSDHGDSVGDQGMFFKSNLYEGSVGIPMIIAGEGVKEQSVCETPVSLLDIYPSTFECVGAKNGFTDKPGKSLWQIANEKYDHHRVVMAEYHAVSSNTGSYMLRKGDYKLNYYVGYPSQLFNLKYDPDECMDLIDSKKFANIAIDLEDELRKLLNPEEVNRKAFEAQRILVEANGGFEHFKDKPKAFEFTPVEI